MRKRKKATGYVFFVVSLPFFSSIQQAAVNICREREREKKNIRVRGEEEEKRERRKRERERGKKEAQDTKDTEKGKRVDP